MSKQKDLNKISEENVYKCAEIRYAYFVKMKGDTHHEIDNCRTR